MPLDVSSALLNRVVSCATGAFAAIALWWVSTFWNVPDVSALLLLGLFSFILLYAVLVLVLIGPVELGRAAFGALWLAVPMTALILSAGLRETQAGNVLDNPVMISVVATLLVFATPFLLVRLQERELWLEYAALFEAAWTLYTRFVLALFFVGAIWIVLFLSNALLTLVEVTFIAVLLRFNWISFAISGASLGLGLAVLHELRDAVSPFVVLRLLRLLVPVVLGVVLIFLIAAPFRELARLFGEFSAAGTLMGTSMVAITLISCALDRTEAQAVHTHGLRAATRILALVLPGLTGLALWAVALRVEQYGWTPDRVLAGTAAIFLMAYALAYAGVSLVRPGWSRRIRTANVVMALAVVSGTAAWLTPVLDPYRIAANSQVSRFVDREVPLAQLPLWEMSHFWGKAGEAGLARLEAMQSRPDHAEIMERIAEARAVDSLYQFERAIEIRELPARARTLADLMVVQPGGDRLPPASFAALDPYQLTRWLEACERRLPDGRAGCVMVRGAFSPEAAEGAEAMLLYLEETNLARANYVALSDGVIRDVRPVVDPKGGGWPALSPDALASVLDGVYDIRPSGANALWMEDAVIMRGN